MLRNLSERADQEKNVQLVKTDHKKMSSGAEVNVEEQFFFNPDLMEKFLPYLDIFTLLNLCKSKISCAFDILRNKNNPAIFNKMIGRSLPDIPYPMFEEARTQSLPIISLLKMMQAKDDYDAFHHTLTYLEALCEKFPARDGRGSIQLAASGHKSYSVTPLALRLLEEIEMSLGSTLQEIESVKISSADMANTVLPALASRVSRQKGVMTNMNIGYVYCFTKKNVDDLLVLTNKTLTGRLAYVDVRLDAAEAEEGFSLLARALSPVSLQVQLVEIGVKEALLARRVDLRTILESLDSAGPRPGELGISGNWEDDDHGGMFPVTGGFEAVEHYLEGMGQRMDN